MYTRKDVKTERPVNDKIGLPLKEFTKRKSDNEVRYNPRNQQKTANFQDKEDLEEDYGARAIPINGRMIEQEILSFSDDDAAANAQMVSFREVFNKQKNLMKTGFPAKNLPKTARSKSQMEEKQKNQIIEVSMIKKNPITLEKITKIVPDNYKEKSNLNITQIKSNEDKKLSETIRTVEVRRKEDSGSPSLEVTQFQQINDSIARKKFSLSKLFQMNWNGEEDFFEGTLIKNAKTGFCRVLYSNGVYKEGFFANDCLEGEGQLKYPNGANVTGFFQNDQICSNIVLNLENAEYPVEFNMGEYHNDRLFMSDKNILVLTAIPFDNFLDYSGKARVFFRNGYKLETMYEKGIISIAFECFLIDKFETMTKGQVRLGLNMEKNGAFVFRPFHDLNHEYLLLLKGEGTVVKKAKK